MDAELFLERPNQPLPGGCPSFFNGPPAADQPLWPPIGLQFRQVFTPTNTRSHAVYYRMVTLPQVLHNFPHVLISLFEDLRKELYKANVNTEDMGIYSCHHTNLPTL